jgi:hypothetical protein
MSKCAVGVEHLQQQTHGRFLDEQAGLNAARNNPDVRHASPCRDDVPTRRGNALSLPTGASSESFETANRHKTRSAPPPTVTPAQLGPRDSVALRPVRGSAFADCHALSDSLMSLTRLMGATVRTRS